MYPQVVEIVRQSDGKSRSPYKKRVFFAVFAAVLALAGFEIAARIAGYAPPRKSTGFQESKFRPDKELIWSLTPGWTGEEGAGKIRINSMGLRDDEIPAPKPAGETRILSLGDSVTFGYWVGQDEPWPKALESLYRAKGEKARSINAGVPGYSTFQERDQLRLAGWKLDPDVVILGYCLNDAIERYTTVAQYGGKEVFLGVNTSRQLPLSSRLLRHIAIYRLIALKSQNLSKRRELYSVRRLDEEPLMPEIEKAWEQNKAEITGLAQDVRGHGKRFIVVIFPFFFQLTGNGETPIMQRRIMDLCKQNGIKCLDLFPIFYAHRAEPLFLDDDHLTPTGHLRAAEAIFDALSNPD